MNFRHLPGCDTIGEISGSQWRDIRQPMARYQVANGEISGSQWRDIRQPMARYQAANGEISGSQWRDLA